MGFRTRADMHIGLDLILNTLNATPTNRMDPPIKDYFLNRTISQFVKDAIKKVNTPDEVKRVPFRILTYGDILNKYNDIYTLIKETDSLVPVASASNDTYFLYNYPSDIYRFETSYSYVIPRNCIAFQPALSPTFVLLGAGNIAIGTYNYFVVFHYGMESSIADNRSIGSITLTDASQVELSNIPLGSAGCVSRSIYRTTNNGKWYEARLLTTIPNNISTTFVDNLADGSLGAIRYSGNFGVALPNVLLNSYDVTSFNINPFGGKKKYIATSLHNEGIKVYHLNRYNLTKFGVVYIKKPALLTSSPGIINCDLPDSTHDEIVENTAKFIAAAVANNNYEFLLNEAKSKMQ